ncbi:hypothetical protein M758_1G219500 [Ceratodon purpureus]|nr:hypothetical protein M758_1G219500 [Ceratodon purpureus]
MYVAFLLFWWRGSNLSCCRGLHRVPGVLGARSLLELKASAGDALPGLMMFDVLFFECRRRHL